MLAAPARLRASADFRGCVRRGQRAARERVVVHALPRSPLADGSLPATQVGFVVSKAVGGAVVRNRVKRQLRHLARPLAEADPGLQVVVRALPPAASASHRDLGDDLASAWRRAAERSRTRA